MSKTKILLLLVFLFFTAKTVFANNLSKSLIITEVFPNPKGNDKNNEWIEIYNPTSQSIDLKDYTISSSSDKTKIKEKTIIENRQLLVLPDKIIPTLKNTSEKLTILSPENFEIDKIEYSESKENLSLSRINTLENNKIIQKIYWTDTSPGSKNPQFEKAYIKLKSGILIEKTPYIIAKKSDNKIVKILLDENKLNLTFLNKIIVPNLETSMTFKRINDENYELIDFTIINPEIQKTTNQKDFFPLIIKSCFLITGILSVYLIFKQKTIFSDLSGP